LIRYAKIISKEKFGQKTKIPAISYFQVFRYRTIYNSYYHSSHGIVVVFDLCNEKSFENLEQYWLKEIRNHAPQNAVLLLVGNKADLEGERRVGFDRAER
jgi:GTPase SAR1 family protein